MPLAPAYRCQAIRQLLSFQDHDVVAPVFHPAIIKAVMDRETATERLSRASLLLAVITIGEMANERHVSYETYNSTEHE
jgi:hypothetical protein